MIHSARALIASETGQLGIIAIGLPVSAASFGLQIFAVIALVVVVAATSRGARAAWRTRPARSR